MALNTTDDLDNVELRVRTYVLRTGHRDALSPEQYTSAVNFAGEHPLLMPLRQPFATSMYFASELGWRFVGCWMLWLLWSIEANTGVWCRPDFALALAAAYFSSRATGAIRTWSVHAQVNWNCAGAGRARRYYATPGKQPRGRRGARAGRGGDTRERRSGGGGRSLRLIVVIQRVARRVFEWRLGLE